MIDSRRCWPAFSLLVGAFFVGAIAARATAAEPSYDKDVRPILSQFCFKCHGPDDARREAGLRLDTTEGATQVLDSGKRAIVAKAPHASELVRRILTDDADERMPPVSTKFSLTEEQKKTLQDWIASGARYTPHWSFVAPKATRPPSLANLDSIGSLRTAIDAFVVGRLQSEKLSLSAEADKYTLVRRATLDLIGLPPTSVEAEQFARDASPDAFERLLDRLLASPHYGERWGRKWLDLARYADTNGYEKDRPRTVWPYRDWVINALNADLPFDQFSIEQLAGDMLSGSTIDQRIATGFHRNTMLNEEGGIDPLEFRFYAMTDRVATTGTTWLALTLGCAQCHTHKYDPITHRDYYGFFALLNNADEPEQEIVRPDLAAKRAELQRQIERRERELPDRFPLPDEYDWQTVKPVKVRATSGATLEVLGDQSVLVSGPTPDGDTYEIQFETTQPNIAAVRLEALTDSQLPSQGPGRTPHGNFVLSEIRATYTNASQSQPSQSVKFVRATADFAQQGFPIENAIDGNATSKAGWAIDTGNGKLNVNRTATFYCDPIVTAQKPTAWTIRLEQTYGGRHVLGKFRLSLGTQRTRDQSDHDQRRAHFEQKFGLWYAKQRDAVVNWVDLKPVVAKSDLPLLTIQPDGSILASGDQSKHDLYEIQLANALANVTALRIEVLPDASLPKNGPGRVYYEGPFGDFFLSEVSLSADQKPIKLVGASHSFANGMGAPACLDGNQQTGWSIDGGQGKPHSAVFRFEKPVTGAAKFDLTLLFERYYAAGLGRFRIAVTDDRRPVEATALPAELERIILSNPGQPSEIPELVRYFCSVATELVEERKPIDELRKQASAATTALVMSERPANNPRNTHRYHRGEFLQPKEIVAPAGLSMLPPLPNDRATNRLALAQWLVNPANPLTARVTVNRHWASLFGRGIVRTTEDFGSQGAGPTHPELLDWLAVELSGSGRSSQTPMNWSIKRLHRLMLSSATYRQTSSVTPELLKQDPTNELLGRAPRVRLDAELVRDLTLQVSGLLSEKIGGPSVFPAQPTSVTTEGTYGSLPWTVSTGEDRYRRSLYTFSKRTSPYAMFMTFDGPSGEACIARREVTNTPLQALTMLNDTVVMEAAQALGREFAARSDSDQSRMRELFVRCVTRPPTEGELDLLGRYFANQSTRLRKNELNAIAIAGEPSESRAAWTLLARTLLNLDETIMKE